MTIFHGTKAITHIEHEGVTIVHQYDTRGPSHPDFYDLFHYELDGVEYEAASLDEAYDAIDNMLDANRYLRVEARRLTARHQGYDSYADEHRLRSWQLV